MINVVQALMEPWGDIEIESALLNMEPNASEMEEEETEVNCRLVSKLFFFFTSFSSYGEKSDLIGFFDFFPPRQ
jgi:hypothetical protein